MKELSIEEKAKRYDEAIKVAKRNYETIVQMDNNCTFAKEGIVNTFHHIFPELIENGDEKIRKSLVEYLHTLPNHYAHNGICALEWLAWLEKQGQTFTKKDVDDAYLKGICDAKHELEKQGEQKPTDEEMKELLRTEYEKGRADAIAEMQNPWSEEDESMLTRCIGILGKCYIGELPTKVEEELNWLKYLSDRVQLQPKQEWSEEDVNRINRLIAYFEDKESFTAEDDVVYANWLKSLKERVQPQPKQEWSEEDEINLNYIIRVIERLYDKQEKNYLKESLDRKINWLRLLKERVQPKQEWNEEDEKEIAVLEAYIRSKDWSEKHIDRALGIVDELVNKVKTLRPQTTWKPSDEQMDALYTYIYNPQYFNSQDPRMELVESVYKDLKKLK